MQKLFKSATITTWFFSGSKLIILLFLTSLIIKKFNVGEIALWYLFSSVQGLAHLFDIGFSSTIIRFTAYNRAIEDPKDTQKNFQKLYNSMNTVFIFLVLIVFAFLSLIGYFSVWPLIIKNEISNGLLSFAPIFFILPLNFFLKKNDAFIKGMNEVSLYNNWNAVLYFATGLITIIMLLLEMPFYLVVLTSQLGILINSIKNIFLLKQVVDFDLKLFAFSYDKSIINNYWKPTWKSALISLSSNGMNHVTNIMIPMFFSIELVASYLFSMRLIQFINEFSWAPFYSQIPKYIKEYKQGKLKKLSIHAYSRLNLSLLLVIGGLFVLGVSANYVIPFLEAKTQFIEPPLVGFVMLMIVFERFIAMHSQIIMFANDIQHYKHYLLLSAIYLLLLYPLIKILGIYGISVAYLIAACYPLIIISRRSFNLFEIPTIDYVKQNLDKSAMAVTICFLILIFM